MFGKEPELMPRRTKAASKKSRGKKTAAAKPSESCRHCRGGAETFRYMKKNYLFDVDAARKIVQDGREPLEMDEEDTRHSVDISRIYPEHLPHVNTTYPGIVAHLWYEQPTGAIEHGTLLIDGHHRAARCLDLGETFRVHVLTEEESRAIMLTAPDVYERALQLEAVS